MYPPGSRKDQTTLFEDIEHFQLEDLINLQQIESLNQAFASAIGFAATVVDLRGNPIVPPCNHSLICQLIRSTPKGLANCMRSGKTLGQKAHALKRPYASPCYSIGFVDAAAPIIVEGKHVATWLVGQASLADVDQQRVMDYAEEIGADGEQMLAAFHTMTDMPREEFESKLDFLWRVSQQISSLGYKNLQYAKAFSQLQESQKELKRYKMYLESLVEERTEELNQALKRMEDLSKRDYLTGCFNRQHLNCNLDTELKRSHRYQHSLSIILCDIDHFKKVNDLYGHQCGDQLLVEFAKLIQASMREGLDRIVRYGGEEFLIILPETELSNAYAMAERIRRSIEEAAFSWKERSITITSSFGLAAYMPEQHDTVIDSESLIQAADRNLYRAKSEGRNRVVCDPYYPSQDNQ